MAIISFFRSKYYIIFKGKRACLVAFNLRMSVIKCICILTSTRYQISSLACPHDDRGNEGINFSSWSVNVDFLRETFDNQEKV